MSHLDDLDDFEAELELRLKREYNDVFHLFRYCVLTQDATYLCNKLEVEHSHRDAYPFFQAVDGLVRTGLTETNVMDVRVILLGGS